VAREGVRPPGETSTEIAEILTSPPSDHADPGMPRRGSIDVNFACAFAASHTTRQARLWRVVIGVRPCLEISASSSLRSTLDRLRNFRRGAMRISVSSRLFRGHIAAVAKQRKWN